MLYQPLLVKKNFYWLKKTFTKIAFTGKKNFKKKLLVKTRLPLCESSFQEQVRSMCLPLCDMLEHDTA